MWEYAGGIILSITQMRNTDADELGHHSFNYKLLAAQGHGCYGQTPG